MGNSDDATRRRDNMDASRKIITGNDPRLATSEDARQAQRFKIAEFVRQAYDGGYDPMVLVEMLLAGAAFVGDNYGVSRQQMAKVICEMRLADERQLIYTGKG